MEWRGSILSSGSVLAGMVNIACYIHDVDVSLLQLACLISYGVLCPAIYM
jgi:hypothetical protein